MLCVVSTAVYASRALCHRCHDNTDVWIRSSISTTSMASNQSAISATALRATKKHQDMATYSATTLQSFVPGLVETLMLEQPADPVNFLRTHLDTLVADPLALSVDEPALPSPRTTEINQLRAEVAKLQSENEQLQQMRNTDQRKRGDAMPALAAEDAGQEHENAHLAQRREQLRTMRIRALYRRAEELGVDDALLDAAEDADDAKSVVVDLILTAEGSPMPAVTDSSMSEQKSEAKIAIDKLSTPDAQHAFGHATSKKAFVRAQLANETLSDIFSELAGDDGMLEFVEFKNVLVERLQLSLRDHEIERVWNRLVAERMAPSPEGVSVLDLKLTRKEFLHGVENISFLRCCVQMIQDKGNDFIIPSDYDYGKSTNDNYAVPASTASFVGDYVSIRETRDYSYHVHYTPERQLWQDHAIKTVVSRTEKQGSPWVVYTCGPMGAGKGFVLSWMSRNGYFPLEDIVCIDPDHFKTMMPEWRHYTTEGSDAGTLCHRESGFLQEIAQEVAMRSSQNVWVDGSLRDGRWFAQVFKSIRRRFPHYKIAIFEVSASEDIVRERIKERAEREGRDIPEHLIVQSLASVANSLNILMPLVDFVARIDNDGPSPNLRAYIRINADGNWCHIQDRFARPELAGTFPSALSTLKLRVVPKIRSLLLEPEAVDSTLVGHLELDVRSAALASIWDAILDSKMVLSPACEVSLQGQARILAGIPTEATSFAFAYPAELNWQNVPDLPLHNPESLLSMLGGFFYFDATGAICGANTVTAFMEDEEPDLLAEQPNRSGLPEPLLQFCPPLPLPEVTYRALESAGRLRPVTIASLLDKGAYAFAWIVPGEKLDGLTEVPKAGAFAYFFRPSTLQAALETIIQEEDGATGTSKGDSFNGYFPAEHEGCYYPVAC